MIKRTRTILAVAPYDIAHSKASREQLWDIVESAQLADAQITTIESNAYYEHGIEDLWVVVYRGLEPDDEDIIKWLNDAKDERG